MLTLLVRDEQGNMRVVHDWHSHPEPHLMGADECAKLAGKIRNHYPNTTHGLEFVYYYTGDDHSPTRDRRITDAYDSLPRFGRFLFSDLEPEPDTDTPRVRVARTEPPARRREDVDRQVAEALNREPVPLLDCACGWKGNLSDAAEYDAEYPHCIDWTCPSCSAENVCVGEGSPDTDSQGFTLPINAES